MSRITNKDRILKFLKDNGSITQLQALKEFWDWRLSASIFTLKKEGYPIKTEMIEVKRKDGTKAYVAKYILETAEGDWEGENQAIQDELESGANEIIEEMMFYNEVENPEMY